MVVSPLVAWSELIGLSSLLKIPTFSSLAVLDAFLVFLMASYPPGMLYELYSSPPPGRGWDIARINVFVTGAFITSAGSPPMAPVISALTSLRIAGCLCWTLFLSRIWLSTTVLMSSATFAEIGRSCCSILLIVKSIHL